MNQPQGRLQLAQMGAEEFQKEILKTFDGDEYTIRSAYKGHDKRIVFFHGQCGLTWRTTPERFLDGHRCPQCSTVSNRRMRDIVSEALQHTLPLYGSRGVSYNHYFGSGPQSKTGFQLAYDFWLPDLRILVDAEADIDDEPWGKVNGTDFRLRSMVIHHELKKEWAEIACLGYIMVPRNTQNVRDFLDREIGRLQAARRTRKY